MSLKDLKGIEYEEFKVSSPEGNKNQLFLVCFELPKLIFAELPAKTLLYLDKLQLCTLSFISLFLRNFRKHVV